MFVVLVEVLTEENCRGGDEINCTVCVFLHLHVHVYVWMNCIHVHTASCTCVRTQVLSVISVV